MKACPNGHPVTEVHTFCQECGAATIDVEPTCPNGHVVKPGFRFCNECGLPVVAAPDVTAPLPVIEPAPPTPPPPVVPPPPAPTPPVAGAVPPQPPAQRGRRWPLVAAAVVLLGLIIAGGVWFATKSDNTVEAAGGQSSSTTKSPATSASTQTTLLRTPPTSSASESLEIYYRQLDAILGQWVGNRGKLSDALNSLGSCTDPTAAASQIQTIAEARQTELDQVNRLTAPDQGSATAKASLVEALDNSLQSDTSYQQVVSAMTTCEPISPTDPNPLLVAARRTDQAATDAKIQFVAVYNPAAARYGLRSDWAQADL